MRLVWMIGIIGFIFYSSGFLADVIYAHSEKNHPKILKLLQPDSNNGFISKDQGKNRAAVEKIQLHYSRELDRRRLIEKIRMSLIFLSSVICILIFRYKYAKRYRKLISEKPLVRDEVIQRITNELKNKTDAAHGRKVFELEQKNNKLLKRVNELESQQARNRNNALLLQSSGESSQLSNHKNLSAHPGDGKEKGDLFEQYVVKKIFKDVFSKNVSFGAAKKQGGWGFKDWRSDKYIEAFEHNVASSNGELKGLAPHSNTLPDLEFVYFADGHIVRTVMIECKFRSNWSSPNGERYINIVWHDEEKSQDRSYKLQQYLEMVQALNNSKVFFYLGVGGAPDKPDEEYLVNLEYFKNGQGTKFSLNHGVYSQNIGDAFR